MRSLDKRWAFVTGVAASIVVAAAATLLQAPLREAWHLYRVRNSSGEEAEEELRKLVELGSKRIGKDLADRFVHPQRHEQFGAFPRDMALEAMRRVGLLKRGKSREEVEALFGPPLESFSNQKEWVYGLKSACLIVELGLDGRAERFCISHDEGGPPSQYW